MTELPLLIEPQTLEQHLGDGDILLVDLSKADTYRRLHVPGAVFLDYGRIVAMNRPVMGLLPEDGTLHKVFSPRHPCRRL
jgi:thiosulfate/3-mercaptopyruvate sulfurtransferase